MRSSLQRLGLAATIAALLSGAALAADPPANVRDGRHPSPDANGHIPQKITHQISPDAGSIITSVGRGTQSAPSHLRPPTGSTSANRSPIKYHGGPVMPGVSRIVVIWYGNWNQTNNTDTPAGQQIIRDALYGLALDGGSVPKSPYAGAFTYSAITESGTLSKYSDSLGDVVKAVSSAVIAECSMSASPTYGGSTLSDATVMSLAQWAAGQSCSQPAGSTASGPDPAAVYLVLSSSDIGESSGFLSSYCGWHSYTTTSGIYTQYGFIGNPAKQISSCSYQPTSSPNGNPGVDAMISVIAHELEETVTDPQLNAWYNSAGSEDGDMCAWTFGSHQQAISSSNPFYLGASNSGSYYNIVLPAQPGTGGLKSTGYRPYLVQRALASSNSKCYINATGSLQ
jgi:Phosphate-induced protein 1 conserved region